MDFDKALSTVDHEGIARRIDQMEKWEVEYLLNEIVATYELYKALGRPERMVERIGEELRANGF